MKGSEVKVKIYNQRFNEGLGFKTIARNLGISKNTVKSYVKVFEDNLSYCNTLSAEEYDEAFLDLFKKNKMNVSKRKSKLITKDIDTFIRTCLDENERKIESGNRKMTMKNVDIYDELCDCLNYEGGISTINNYIAKIKDKSKEAFIKRYFEAGEVCEFDWGNVKLTINDEVINFKLAVFSLPYSNFRYAFIYESENMEAFVDSHIKFFKLLGAVPKTLVYDNMRVAVAKFVGKQEKKPTQTLVEMSTFYNYDFRFCNAYSGNEKGSVERAVEFVRRKSFCFNSSFNNLDEAKKQLEIKLDKINSGVHEKFDLEIQNMKIKKYDFVYGTIETCAVDKYSTISVKRHRYSVPDTLVGKTVKVKVTIDYVHIYHNDTKIAMHKRSVGMEKWTLDIYHYTRVLSQKPGGILDSLAFKTMDKKLKTLYIDNFIGLEKDFIKTLELINTYGIDKINETINQLDVCSSSINFDSINIMIDSDKRVMPYVEANNEVLLASNTSINKYAGIGG